MALLIHITTIPNLRVNMRSKFQAVISVIAGAKSWKKVRPQQALFH